MTSKINVLALIVLVVVVLGIGFISLSSFATTPEQITITEPADANNESEMLYGLAIAGYDIETKSVERNEFLSGILQRYQIDLPSISVIADKSKAIFDVRKIAAGHDY